MVEIIIIKQIHYGDKVFHIGDKVKMYTNNKGIIVGTITGISAGGFWMEYYNGYCDYPYLTRDIKLENKPYNESGFFFSSDVDYIEKI